MDEQLFWRLEVNRNCLNCGKEFTPRTNHVRRGMGIYCSRSCHYAHKRSLPKPDFSARFWAKVDKNGPLWEGGTHCWIWTGYIDNHGYGRFTISRQKSAVHAYKVAYSLTVNDEKVEGFQFDHLCRNRACVNPSHLEVVPQAVNLLRGVSPPADNARKTHCIAGHELTPENTYMWGPDKKWRGCLACRNRRNAISNAKKRGAK
jgi:hypothetical protein